MLEIRLTGDKLRIALIICILSSQMSVGDGRPESIVLNKG